VSICRSFDHQKTVLFSQHDLLREGFTSVNRKGEPEEIPLVTLSLAVLGRENLSQSPHPGEIGQLAAALKRRVKISNMETGASGHLIDRRRSSCDPAGAPGRDLLRDLKQIRPTD
jgi:hypothetical protein